MRFARQGSEADPKYGSWYFNSCIVAVRTTALMCYGVLTAIELEFSSSKVERLTYFYLSWGFETNLR